MTTRIAVALLTGVLLLGVVLWFSPRVRATVSNILSNLTITQARRLIVFVVGFTVLLAGLAMLLLPGPGVVVTIAGLGVLGTEFLWARRLLRKVRETTGQVYNSIAGTATTADPGPPTPPVATEEDP